MHKYGAATIITNAQKLHNRIEYNPYIYIFIKISNRIQFVCVHNRQRHPSDYHKWKKYSNYQKVTSFFLNKVGEKNEIGKRLNTMNKNIFNQFAYLLSDYRKKLKLLLNFVLFLFLFV